MVQPRLNEGPGEHIRLGDVVLQDFKAGLEVAGFPPGVLIERFVDTTDNWVRFYWNWPISIYGRNKVIYIKAAGLDVTPPPDHFIELITPA